MKTIVISLSLLLMLLACGKLPEDPHSPRKPVLPGMVSTFPALFEPNDRQGTPGQRPAGGLQRFSAVRSK